MNTNPPPVGPASDAVSRRPTRARRSATVAGHPQHHPPTSPGVAPYIENTSHITGPGCLCSSCHLKPRLFPRDHHGRILLPKISDPSKPDSTTRFLTSMGPPRSRAPSAAAAIATAPSVLSRAMYEERGGSRPRPTQLDRGEGTSTGLSRLSGPGVPAGMRDDWTRLPPLLRDFEVPDPIFTQHATPRISHSQRNRSLTVAGRARPSKDSKPYDFKSNRPALRPQAVERSELDLGTRSSNQMPSPSPGSASQVYASHQSAPSSSSRTRRQSWPDPYEDLGADKFSQFMGPSNQPGRELNLSGSSTLSQPHSFGSSDTQATSSIASHPTFSTTPPNLSHPSFSQQEESMPLTQTQQPYQFQSSANNFEQSPQVITFNSRSENPKPNVWNQSDGSSQHIVGDDIPHDGPSTQQIQHRVRFQNPVTPDTKIPSPEHPRSLTGFQVKWDSERKRRQGYFAQEEGEEKSPFRHYNKTGCDFDG
ncbi:hypothetical protein M413DRAFT_449015 [Hebeloma cylindrosporum]|uniref:Uncharacterized protein n=1 Tax=Hebeloma cylindrosporum TaxID=76867 RepID=A0A0C2Y6L6_HEBCY|nr:hypothetical protein M413DRAFT_449015 [Hebeloma cylindrosporum h7]